MVIFGVIGVCGIPVVFTKEREIRRQHSFLEQPDCSTYLRCLFHQIRKPTEVLFPSLLLQSLPSPLLLRVLVLVMLDQATQITTSVSSHHIVGRSGVEDPAHSQTSARLASSLTQLALTLETSAPPSRSAQRSGTDSGHVRPVQSPSCVSCYAPSMCRPTDSSFR